MSAAGSARPASDLAQRASTVLAVDVTGAQCAVVLFKGASDGLAPGETVEREAMDRGHAERLFPLIDRVIARAGVGFDRVDAFAAVRGPGSFTGVRLGLAAVRGLALARGAPALGVDGFWAIAAAAHRSGARGPVSVVFGKPPRLVRRLFRLEEDGPVVLGPMGAAEASPQESAATLFTGPGAAAYCADHPEARLLRGDGLDAVDARLAARLAQAGGAAVGPPAPLYLRPPDATPSPDAPPRRLGPRP